MHELLYTDQTVETQRVQPPCPEGWGLNVDFTEFQRVFGRLGAAWGNARPVKPVALYAPYAQTHGHVHAARSFKPTRPSLAAAATSFLCTFSLSTNTGLEIEMLWKNRSLVIPSVNHCWINHISDSTATTKKLKTITITSSHPYCLVLKFLFFGDFAIKVFQTSTHAAP